jgi:hypothetical protein
MAFIHGKGTIVLYNEFNLSSYFNEASASRSVETAETTTFGNSAKTYITGLIDGTLSLSGMFDGAANAIDQELTDVLGLNDGANITVAPEGSLALGLRTMSLKGELTSYEVSSPVGDVVSASSEFQADNGIASGISLHDLVARTATGTGTSVDNATSSTRGGFGTLHVTANTMDANTVLKVQHSADNSTWVDLVTFSTVATTVKTSERVEVSSATTVNRYLRATWTASGTGSITFHINFARR